MKQLPLQIMVWLGLLFILLFAYVPIFGIIIGFQDYNIGKGFLSSPFVGFKHFKEFLSDAAFYNAALNTIILALMKLVFCFPLPILLAVIFNELPNQRLRKFSQTASYFPHFMAYVVVATLWLSLLSVRGPLNIFLMNIGAISSPIEFWYESSLFRWLAIIVENWKEVGWGSIIYFAAISGIDTSLYEAAEIDGASRIQKISFITLPSIRGTIIIMFILAMGGLFRGNLDQSVLLGNPFNKSSSYILELYSLDMGFKTMRQSYATAVGLFQSFISLALVLSANKISGKLSGSKIF